MGSSKKVTVSYWYKLIMHLGWCKGPIDALLEIRGGDRVAWRGRKEESGDLYINKPDLYGGESAEGGIQGTFEVMMGEPDQMPNAYLASEFGDAQPGYRGRATILLKGPKIGAGNPYPKPLFFKLERIFKGWDNGEVWYPEKASVPLQDGRVELLGSGWEYQAENFSEPNTVWSDFSIPEDGWLQGGELPYATGSAEWPAMRSNVWIRRKMRVNSSGAQVRLAADNGCALFVDNALVGVSNPNNDDIPNNQDYPVIHQFGATGVVTVVGKAYAEINASDDAGNYVNATFDSLGEVAAMNPAHILYDSITSRRENGGMEEPRSRINEASFRAAADKLHAEGFGLCCTWHGGESAEQFQQRICNVIGGSVTQSRLDGQYYLDLLREVKNPDSLPTITDDDILEWEDEPAVPSEAINQIQVRWFDPTTREARVTTPVQSLGAIQDAGGLIADIREYYEIPVESLALRVAQRDLQSVATALRKFTFSCTRKPFDVRPGMQVRLMCPKRGFADVIVVVADIDYGDFGNNEIHIVALQDVFSLPESAFVSPQEGLNPPPPTEPVVIADQVAMETPYVELAAAMTTADLNALEADTAYLMVGARRPANGINYQVATRAAGEEYEEYGTGDWTPSARVVEGDNLVDAEPATSFTLASARMLDQVETGTWALWGSEMVRVDSLDPEALTVVLGRAVGDTVPVKHDPDEMIFFIGDWYATDSREYAQGETVNAKLLNRTSQGQVPPALAQELTVEMQGRQSLPYPPGQFKINGAYYPSTASGPSPLTVTWVGRNRRVQADQLIETTAGGISPPAGTTYTLRGYENNALLHEETGITGEMATWVPSQSSVVRVELESADILGRPSYQFHSHEMEWVSSLPDDLMAAQVISKLAHWWPLDEAAGRRMKDVHGGREMWVNGSVTLAQAALRPSGGASVRVDATSEYLTSMGKPFWTRRQPHDVGIVAWVQPDSITSSRTRFVVGDAIASDTSDSLNMIDNLPVSEAGNVSLFWEYAGGANGGVMSSWTIPDASAQFLGVSRLVDSKVVSIFRNGVAPDGFVPYEDQPTGGDDISNHLTIGNGVGNQAYQFEGLLQDVAMFKAALTTDEHAWLWNGGNGRSYLDVLSLATGETSWPWSPARRAGKVAWLVADDESHELSGGKLARLDNRAGFVEAMFDSNAESGSGVSLAKYGVATLNGRPVLTGDATDRAQARLPNTKEGFNGVNGVLIATVTRFGNNSSAGSVLWQTNETSQSASLFRLNLGAGAEAGRISMGGRRVASNAFAQVESANDYRNQWVLVVAWMDYSAPNIGLRLNGGVEEVVNTSPGWTAGTTSNSNKNKDLYLGRGISSEENRDYSLAEVIVENVAPTQEVIELYEGYLAWEWDMVFLLPSGHPYKTARPMWTP